MNHLIHLLPVFYHSLFYPSIFNTHFSGWLKPSTTEKPRPLSCHCTDECPWKCQTATLRSSLIGSLLIKHPSAFLAEPRSTQKPLYMTGTISCCVFWPNSVEQNLLPAEQVVRGEMSGQATAWKTTGRDSPAHHYWQPKFLHNFYNIFRSIFIMLFHIKQKKFHLINFFSKDFCMMHFTGTNNSE